VHSDYNKESINILEPHIPLLTYYAASTVQTSTIVDNMLYYKQLYNKELNINNLILNNLNIFLSQNLLSTEEREYMNFISGEGLFNNFDKVRLPWGNFNDMYFYLFNIIYGVAAFEFRGTVNENSFVVESIELHSAYKRNLPSFIKSLVIQYNNRYIKLDNTFYKLI
jgi:hypothetical protein